MAGSVVVDQTPYDFQSLEIEFVANGQSLGIIDGIDKIEYSSKVNRTKFYGRGRLPVNRTEGDAEFEASISLTRYWLNFMLAIAANDLNVGWAQMEVVLGVSYYVPNKDIVTDTLTGVRLAELKTSMQHGPEQAMVDVPLDVMNIYMNGADPFNGRR